MISRTPSANPTPHRNLSSPVAQFGVGVLLLLSVGATTGCVTPAVLGATATIQPRKVEWVDPAWPVPESMRQKIAAPLAAYLNVDPKKVEVFRALTDWDGQPGAIKRWVQKPTEWVVQVSGKTIARIHVRGEILESSDAFFPVKVEAQDEATLDLVLKAIGAK